MKPGPDLTRSTLLEQAALLRAGECSSRELVDACLARIERFDRKLHAFVSVYADDARRRADAADRARHAGFPVGPLHGIPIALKDLLEIEGRVTTMGSAHWRGRTSGVTATVVERLLDAGMIPLGKTHMVEFAFGAWGTNPHMGAPWNPWDAATQRVPGGSSSGSAVAVAAGLAPAAIGSDTGGSIRNPAALNGITGLKVTYGRVSLHGAMLLSWTLDTIGPMAKTVADCAALLDVIAGADPRDPATLHAPAWTPVTGWPETLHGIRVAVPPPGQLPSFAEAAVLDAWRNTARVLGEAGAEIVETRLPEWFFDIPPTLAIIATEALAQHQPWIDAPENPIGEGVRTRIRNARRITGVDYALILRQMHERRRAFAHAFEPFDALLLPSVGVVAPTLAELDEQSNVPAYFTRPVNYLGMCGVSIPAGSHDGLPIGMQVIGKPFAEARILQIANACEQRIGWRCTPDLSGFAVGDS